jgi:IMP cyclohydrolase
MYVGRIVGIGRTHAGKNVAVYRVSSRSFPNRRAVSSERGDVVCIVPRDPTETTDNPYVSYTCAQSSGNWLVVSNGSHTESIMRLLRDGIPPLEALRMTLFAFGYEKDEFSTPRIAGVVSNTADKGWLGIIRNDGTEVREVDLCRGWIRYVATYQHVAISDTQKVVCTETESAKIARAVIDAP